MSDNSSTDRSYSKSPRNKLEKSMQTTCKQILKAKVFRGSYQERRRIESLGGYRDLIVVCESDKSFINNLKYVKDRISKFYPDKDIWIGISSKDMIGAPAAGICIWTEVTDLAFGQYWFTVKTVRFRDNEVIIKLNVAAELNSEIPLPNENKTEINVEKLGELLVSWWNAVIRELYEFLNSGVTKGNIIATLKFILILALSLFAAAIECLKFLGIFTLQFMAEARKLLNTSTPIILKLIDLFGKCIGAVFIFLTMIYRDIRGYSSNPPSNYKSIMNAPKYYRDQQRIRY